MKHWNVTLFAVVAMIASLFAMPSFAQEPGTATVHGHVTEAVGAPMTKGQVRFTKDKNGPAKDRRYLYTVPLDAAGDYKATGVAPGDYLIVVAQDATVNDYFELSLKAGDDKTLNFDMTRPQYLAALSPEVRKQIEDFKKKNADSSKAVANLNATLATVRADLTAAAKTHDDVSKDVDSMQSAIQGKPEEPILWFTLGDALSAQADFIAKTDHAAGKQPSSDDAYTKEYSDAADAYKKSADLSAASKKPDSLLQGTAYNQIGSALAKTGRVSDAISAFDMAAKTNPPRAGMYFGNEAIVLFNNNQPDGALVAANKAIAVSPDAPEPYFIKGQSLLTKATLDSKTQKLAPPPDCIPAYLKYLSLTPNPNGANAQTARDVLTGLGQKVDTSYKAKK